MDHSVSNRNPYQFPQFENDDNFKGKRNITSKMPMCTAEAQGDVFNRLFNKETLSSKRHEHHYFDPQSPLDSLDFDIKATYNQTTDAFMDCNQVVLQRETCTDNHGRKLKNRVKEVPLPYDPMYPPLNVTTSKTKAHPHKNPGVVQGHHASSTNQGYVRKHDGGFYVI